MTDFDASFRSTPPTGSGVGNREQLLDLTTVLSPRQAPVYGLLPKQAATADLVEWTVDDLRDPGGDCCATPLLKVLMLVQLGATSSLVSLTTSVA